MVTGNLTYAVGDDWPEGPARTVVDGLAAFNAGFSTVGAEQKLAVTASDATGTVVGGMLGRTDHGWLYVGWLWVHDSARGHGVGTRVMQLAEARARERGCHNAHLTTLEFQARTFYERLGYEVFGVLEDYPRPHKRFFMRKRLDRDVTP